MNYTTNFNLNKPEGTDLYNHLTIDNPNMDIIDGAMQANKLASIGAATELVSGTVHAITRSDSNQNIFKFKATGDFKAGDTVTVDGVSVNVYNTAGQALPDDAYVLSAEVICILDGTSLWVLVNKTFNKADVIEFDNTGTNLSSNNVEDAVKEVNNKNLKFTLLNEQLNIPNTDTAYICNWQNYAALSIEIIQYGNTREQMTIPAIYFAQTSAGMRPYLREATTDKSLEVYQNGAGSIKAKMNAQDASWGFRIYGMKWES